MEKIIYFSMIAFSAIQLYADAYKDELKSIASDRQMIEMVGKEAAADKKGCGKIDEKLDAAVQIEVNIYCQARKRVISRLPVLKKLLDEYEPALKNFFDNCPEVTDDEKLKMCRVLHEKVKEKAGTINKEKEELAKDIDLMENSAKKAADTLRHNQEINEKERGDYLKEELRLKKEIVVTMKTGLEEDMRNLNKSKISLMKNSSSGSKELQEKTAHLLKGVSGLISMNSDLQNTCSGMLRSIDAANNACNLKYSEKGCNDAEKALEEKFNDGNSRIKVYTQEKQQLTEEETQLNKQALSEISYTMQNAGAQITGYLKNIEMQNDMLAQRIELSKKDAEVLRGMENKNFLTTYLEYVKTMISLKVETDGFINKFNEYLKRIDEFEAACIKDKNELGTQCSETGNTLTKEVDATMDRVVKYGVKFNKLNSDLEAFSKKVSGK